MAEPLYDALANKLRLARDIGVGGAEVGGSILTGMAAQPIAGLRGMARLLRGGSLDEAVGDVEGTQEALTYRPRSEVGERGLQNVAGAVESVSKPLRENIADPVGAVSPVLGAALVAAPELLPGPKGRPRVKAPKPRFDPGSPQQLIPGVEPLSAGEAYTAAQGELRGAREAMTYRDPEVGLEYVWDQPNQRWMIETVDNPLEHGERGPMFTAGERPVGNVSATQSPLYAESLEGGGAASPTLTAGGSRASTEYGPENLQRLMANLARLREAEGGAMARGREFGIEESRAATAELARLRAERAQPGITPERQLEIEREILMHQSDMPRTGQLRGGGEVPVFPERTDAAPLYREGSVRWRDPLGEERAIHTPSGMAEQRQLVETLKRQLGMIAPEPTWRGPGNVPPIRRAPPAVQRTYPRADRPSRDPRAMNEAAINRFLTEAQQQEGLFEYGLGPKQGGSLETFTDYFGEKSGKPIEVNWEDYSTGSDEPYKIEVAKEHGRGEIMRDRHGEPIHQTYDAGDKMYEPGTGDLVVDPETGKPVLASGSGREPYVNEQGEYLFAKSRGGEQVRDDRGRVKYRKEENPDYGGESEGAMAELVSGPDRMEITYPGDSEAHITSTGAKGQGGGAAMYQALFGHATKEGIDIGVGSLTTPNEYRMLANVLSNFARYGKNPRDVSQTGTYQPESVAVRGYEQSGAKLWRSEHEEARARLLKQGADPDRVQFDPERGFSIDGSPASPDDIKANIAQLSPNLQSGASKVGQRSLARLAVFDWLRGASPEQAAKVAAEWPKKWGPIFTSIAGAGVLEAIRERAGEPVTD